MALNELIYLVIITSLFNCLIQAYSPALMHEVYYDYVPINSTITILPKFYRAINVFQTPNDSIANYYFQRIHGWFLAPNNGNYTFFCECNSYCQLYLSTDNDPANKILIIDRTENVYMLYNESSTLVYLHEGLKYYIEAVMYNSAMYITQDIIMPPDTSSVNGGAFYEAQLASSDAAAPVSDTLYLSISVRFSEYTQVVPINFLSPLLLIENCVPGGCVRSEYEKCIFASVTYGFCTCVEGQKVMGTEVVCKDIFDRVQDSVFMTDEKPIMRNTYIATLNTFYKEYTISLEVMPTSLFHGVVGVIHLAPDGKFQISLNTLPLLYLIPNANGALYLFTLMEYLIDKTILYKYLIPLTKWSTIKMTQSFVNGNYVYSIYINNVIIYSAKNSNPVVQSNVLVYASDPWSVAQNGFIRNLTINSENSDLKECYYYCKTDNVTCRNIGGLYQCICAVGFSFNYTTYLCQDVNECVDHCKVDNATCKNQIGYYECICPSGYLFNYTSNHCQDIDECVDHCKVGNVSCRNLIGSYECVCPAGYLFNYTTSLCQDIDECVDHCKVGNVSCRNLIGSYECVCPAGYLFNYTTSLCQDIDECVDHCKVGNVSCRNLIGSYECVCPAGYLFNYTTSLCQDIDECADHCKVGNVSCQNLNGSYECVCPAGYFFNYSYNFCEALSSNFLEVHIYMKTSLLIAELFEIIISVVNGKNAELELDFGDGFLPIKESIINSPISINYSFSYIYRECGKFQINVFFKDLFTDELLLLPPLSSYVDVIVFCSLSKIVAVTNPIASLNGLVILKINEELLLHVSQDLGSYAFYYVSWGDGSNQTIDQTNRSDLVPFDSSHTYTKVGEYKIFIDVKNALQSVNETLNVLVRNCSVPKIDFFYGTKTKPITISQGFDKDFIAVLEEVDVYCKNFQSSFEWLLTSAAKEVKRKGVLDKQNVVYKIMKMELPLDSYTLSLLFTYGNDSFNYSAYFAVVSLPLIIQIENGVTFRKVTQKRKIDNRSFYVNFTISANGSYDPYESEDYFDGITFKWRCRLSSNLTYAKSINNFNSTACLSDSWVEIMNESFELNLNTEMFLEGFTYMFELIGSKGTGKELRLGSFIQEIEFCADDFPDLNVICLSNCRQKLNVYERTVFYYNCTNCKSDRLSSIKWKVIEEGGNHSTNEMINVTAIINVGFYLVISNGFLKELTNYTLVLIDENGNKSDILVKMNRLTSSSPTSGYCYVSPLKGYSVLTMFKIICQDWVDNDNSILSYQFFYETSGNLNNQLSYSVPKSFAILNAKFTDQPFWINFLLGEGYEDKNYTIKILIKVFGMYNSYTEVNLVVQVLPNDQLHNITTLLTSIDINDTQVVSNFAQAISKSVNKDSIAAGKIQEESVDEITGISTVNKKLLAKKQAELIRLQKVRTEMINFLSQTTLNDVNDIKNVADALSLLSQAPAELAPQTQDVAVSVISKMANLLNKENLDDVNIHAFNDLTIPFLNSISNMFIAGSLLVNSVLASDETSIKSMLEKYTGRNDQTEKSTQLVGTLMKSMDKYLYASQNYLVPGESSTNIDMPGFQISIKKEYASKLSSLSIGSKVGSDYTTSYGFTFPDVEHVLNQSMQQTIVLLNNVRMKNQPFFWDFENSQYIASETQILSLSTPDRLPIEVKGTAQPIKISIKNLPEKLKAFNISLLMPEDIQVISLMLSTITCNMMLKFDSLNDPNNLTTLIVFIQYGKVATKTDYDIKLKISNKGVKVLQNSNSLIFNTNINYTSDKSSEELSQYNETVTLSNSPLLLKRNQQFNLAFDGTLTLWNFNNSTYAFLNKSVLFLSISYDGPLPSKELVTNDYTFDQKENNGKFLYEIKSFCSQCSYWNEAKNKWMSDGCELDTQASNFEVTKCMCSHLTSFGGLYVKPKVILLPTVALLKKGYVLLVVVACLHMIWILGLFILRQMDKKDISKVGVCSLVDNRNEDYYLYQITVSTGNRLHAGTKSNIFFNLSGDIEDSGVRQLKCLNRTCFQRSGLDTFMMTTENGLGDLNYIKVWHDNKHGAWYLRNIEVIDLQTGKHFHFIANRWLAIDRDDCLLQCVIPVSGSLDVSEFDQIFTTKVRNHFFENHLWFSIFVRSPASHFTRCQRLSVAFSLLLTGMTAAAMFFKQVTLGNFATENKFAGFCFTWQQVYIGFISVCITFPVNIILVGIFRLCKPISKLKTTHGTKLSVFSDSNSRRSVFLYNDKDSQVNIYLREDVKSKSSYFMWQKIKHLNLPHWFLYIAWFACVVIILSSSAIILLYGMSFGNKQSLDWLAGVSLSLIQDILLLQPIKIFLTALVSALFVKIFGSKKEYFDEMQGEVLEYDEDWLYQTNQEATIYDNDDVNISPPDVIALNSMRDFRLKQLKAKSISRELFLYTTFAVLVSTLAYLSQENLMYLQTRNVEELFNLKSKTRIVKKLKDFNQLQSYDDIWIWLAKDFLNQVFPEPWNTLSINPDSVFLSDRTSKIVNGIRIRQIRVKSNSCFKAKLVASIVTEDCITAYDPLWVETQDYDFNWTRPKVYDVQINPSSMPWRYQTPKDLDVYPLQAQLKTYYSGGYVLEIFPKWNNKKIIEQAKLSRWIDRQTRSVIIEFALFNAATNNFNMVIFMLEFPPSGGIVPSYSVSTFKLYSSTSVNNIAILGMQVLFILIMLAFAVHECRMLYRTGWSYFKEFWNLVELTLVLLSFLAVFFYCYRGEIAKKLLQRLPYKQPEIFINFQFASYWDLTYTYIISLIVFFVNLKFIKMLRFNRRVSYLASTLKAAWFELSMLSFVFIIIVCAAVFPCTIIFANLDGYANFFSSIASVLSMMLGKYDFKKFVEADMILGPTFFVGFNVLANWIVLNMFITILNDSFTAIRSEDLKENEYEIIDFLFSQIKAFFGLKDQFLIQRNIVLNSIRSDPVLNRNTSVNDNDENKKLSSNHSFLYSDCNKRSEFNSLSFERIFLKFDKFLKDDFEDEKNALNKFVNCLHFIYFKDEKAESHCLNIDLISL